MTTARHIALFSFISLGWAISSASAQDQPRYDHWHWSTSKGNAHLIGGVAVVEDQGDLRVVVRGNAQFRRIGLMRLAKPERLIIDLPGVRRPRRVQPIVQAGTLASGVRMSRNSGVLRIVVDLSNEPWLYTESKALGNGFEVRLRRPNQPIARLQEPAQEAIKIVDARLKDHGSFVRATIAFDREARFLRDPNEGSLRSLRIPKCSIPDALIQGQDIGSERAPLQSLSTFRDRKIADQCRILIDVAAGAEDAVWTQGKRLFWDIRFAPKVAQRVAAEEDDTEVEDAPEEFEDDPASDTGEEEEDDEEEEEGDEEDDEEEEEEGDEEDDEEEEEEGDEEDDEEDEEEDEEGDDEDDEDDDEESRTTKNSKTKKTISLR